MKRILLITIAIVGCLVGCKSFTPSRQITKIEKDSTYTEVSYHTRDTAIFIPGDTVHFKVPFNKITETPISKKKGNTTAVVRRVGNDLDVQCITDELEHRLDLIDKYIKENNTKTIIEKEVTEVPVPYTPWWKNILSWIGGISLLVLVALVGLKFLKPI